MPRLTLLTRFQSPEWFVGFRVAFLFAVVSVFAMRTLQRHNIKIKIIFSRFVNVILRAEVNVMIKTSSIELSVPRELRVPKQTTPV